MIRKSSRLPQLDGGGIRRSLPRFQCISLRLGQSQALRRCMPRSRLSSARTISEVDLTSAVTASASAQDEVDRLNRALLSRPLVSHFVARPWLSEGRSGGGRKRGGGADTRAVAARSPRGTSPFMPRPDRTPPTCSGPLYFGRVPTVSMMSTAVAAFGKGRIPQIISRGQVEQSAWPRGCRERPFGPLN